MAPRKRKLSDSSSLQVPEGRSRQRSRSPTPDPPSGVSNIANAVRNLFSRTPDPTNPVVNGATFAAQPRPAIGDFFRTVASQATRAGNNASLLSSFIDTAIFDGGYVDDRKYQMEQIIRLAASLPPGTKTLDNLTGQFLKLLWFNIEHPPLSYQGNEFKYRTADGSNNNIMYPHLGKAGSYYARTVTPQTLKPGVLPDPGVIFDTVFARREEAREHPNKISSMLFYMATIIIHDCFHTDSREPSKVKTSSYLDLAPLYGSSTEEQNKIRTFKDGLLKPDTFSEMRLLGFPPGVSAIVVCFNRYHNYVAMQLKTINEGGRFKIPVSDDDAQGLKALDEDLFQTARLVTCGLYINIILVDYVRTILNLNRSDSTWTLDPREPLGDVFGAEGTPSGIGNVVSVEFNLLYRWHSAISKKDEQWSNDLYQQIFGDNYTTIGEEQLKYGLYSWLRKQGDDPSKWTIDNGKFQRNERGAFLDEDLAQILSDATEDVAGAFGPRNVPIVMRLIETMGIEQARQWNVATLNEFRKFFKLTPHATFNDITKDAQVAQSLKALYGHPDYVELYPGLVAEDAKDPMEPGSGLCPGYTISRAILADAVALTRGDRFYTIDYTPANLTNWGFNQVKSDPQVAQGGCFYNLVMRALPNWYRGNSVYAMYPFTVPSENRKILQKLHKADLYSFEPPSYIGLPISIKTWKAVTSVLQDYSRFGVPWGPHTTYLTGYDYMLSDDKPANFAQHAEISEALYCPVNWEAQVQKFYEDLTTQLVMVKSETLYDGLYQLDAVRDIANTSHAIFSAKMFHIPIKGPKDLNPLGVEVDQMHLAFSVMFAYVFLDLDTARSFSLRAGAKASGEAIAKLLGIVCEAVQADRYLHLTDLFRMGRAEKILGEYGTRLIRRFFKGGKSVDEVVWTIIPTVAAAVATQAQHMSQMLDLYLSEKYSHHWPDIQACAYSDNPEDFNKLKKYALEANRLAPAAFGLLRKCRVSTTINDGSKKVKVEEGDQLYTDFVAAGMDPDVFPNPEEIDITRDSNLYLHHGYGKHACIGRPIVEIAMAAQLKVFAKLKNLRRAPGLQGQIKRTVPPPNPVSSDPHENPGRIEAFMKEDWSDWWPFPCCKYFQLSIKIMLTSPSNEGPP
jgi:hypothetical protein